MCPPIFATLPFLRTIWLILGIFVFPEQQKAPGSIDQAKAIGKASLHHAQYPHTEGEHLRTMVWPGQPVQRSTEPSGADLPQGFTASRSTFLISSFHGETPARMAAYLDAIYPSHHFW